MNAYARKEGRKEGRKEEEEEEDDEQRGGTLGEGGRRRRGRRRRRKGRRRRVLFSGIFSWTHESNAALAWWEQRYRTGRRRGYKRH